MHNIVIRIFDTDGQRLTATFQTLQHLIKDHGLVAQVEPVACHLEISRQGLAGREPALQVNDFVVSAGVPISETMLDDCCQRLARWQSGPSTPVS